MARTGIRAGRSGGRSGAALAAGMGKVLLGLALWMGCTRGARAFVGFTAGTGGAFENHDILTWSFRSF